MCESIRREVDEGDVSETIERDRGGLVGNVSVCKGQGELVQGDVLQLRTLPDEADNPLVEVGR